MQAHLISLIVEFVSQCQKSNSWGRKQKLMYALNESPFSEKKKKKKKKRRRNY